MAITWGEIKNSVTDLGFEDDATVESEYDRILVNATNRAASIIYVTVMLPLQSYFENKYGSCKKITTIYLDGEDATEDDDLINIPTELEVLLPLLTAHYIWLDDDITKATIYWNEFDDIKTQIINSLSRTAEIVGGF